MGSDTIACEVVARVHSRQLVERKMWLVNLLSCIVFAAFLVRETLSVALGQLPSSGLLWRLSIDFGYDLTPFLNVMSSELRLSGIATIALLSAVIALIAAGATKRDRRSTFLGIHAATLAIGLCWLVDSGSRAHLSAMTEWAGDGAAGTLAVTPVAPLTYCLCILVAACFYSHVAYIAAAMDEANTSRNAPKRA